MFLSQEWLGLSKAVIHAGFNNDLSYNWQTGDRKAQLLLMEFSDLGIDKTLERAITTNPVMTINDFEHNLRLLLQVRFMGKAGNKEQL